MREYYENEGFIKAHALGISYDDFWHYNPHKIDIMQKAHYEKIKTIDMLAWNFGYYVLSAVNVAVDHNIHGKDAKSKYIEKPLFSDIDKPKEKNEEQQVLIDKTNMELRMKILENMGLQLPEGR